MYNELNQKIMIMQLQAIITSLKSLKNTDGEIVSKIAQAEEFWNTGNIQSCAQVLNVFYLPLKLGNNLSRESVQ